MKKMNKNSEHVLKQIDKQLGGKKPPPVGETIPHEMRLGDVKMEQKRCGAKIKTKCKVHNTRRI